MAAGSKEGGGMLVFWKQRLVMLAVPKPGTSARIRSTRRQ